MVAAASAYIARGMGAEQASELATLIEGVAAGQEGRLMGLGFPAPLATELIRQMVAGTGTAGNLMGLGVPPDLATLIAADIEATSSE